MSPSLSRDATNGCLAYGLLAARVPKSDPREKLRGGQRRSRTDGSVMIARSGPPVRNGYKNFGYAVRLLVDRPEAVLMALLHEQRAWEC